MVDVGHVTDRRNWVIPVKPVELRQGGRLSRLRRFPPRSCAQGYTSAMAVLGFLPGFSHRRHERAGFALYAALTAAAREPELYLRYRLPDTLDGRFDTLALYAVLVMIRLSADSPPGPAVAQAVFDAMFSDLDLTLREMGAGDPTVPRKMKVMWDALHGRALAYQKALANPEDEGLIDALERNIWRGSVPDPEVAGQLARLVRAQAAHLATQALGALTSGQVTFLPVSP